MLDVITLGSNTVDVFAHTDHSKLINIRSSDRNEEFISYPVGGKILINQLLHNFGGNGANTAVCFSRLGFKTGYVGEIGKDINGKLILAHLKKEKVAFLGSRGNESGFSVILDAMEDDRTILVYKGCNNDMTLKEIDFKRIKARWLYMSSMLGKSLVSMRMIAEHAKKNKICVAFNPSATLLETETKTALDLIRYSEVLILNKEEAETLVGNNALEVNIRKLLALGPSIVVITDGKNGATAHHKGVFYRIKPRPDLKIVETTGAGDAFASTLVAALMMKKPFNLCLKMAIIQSENVISSHGAQNHLVGRKALFTAAAKDKRPVDKRKDLF